jgi:uncharacterized protein (DUF2267 family)
MVNMRNNNNNNV